MSIVTVFAPYLNYLKLALLAAVFGAGVYVGSLRGDVKAEKAKTAQEGQGEAIAQADVTALEGQAAHTAAQQINDNHAEAAHGQDNHKIDATPDRADPVIVYRDRPSKVCVAAMPGAEAQARPDGTDPAAGGSQPSDRDGDNRRPEIEALKKQIERVMADYRRLDAEWPR